MATETSKPDDETTEAPEETTGNAATEQAQDAQPSTSADAAAETTTPVDDAAQTSEPAFIDRLREAGFEEVDDEASGQSRLLEAYQEQVARQQEYDRRLRQMEQEAAAYRVQLHQAQQAQTTAPSQDAMAPASQEMAWPQFSEPDVHQVQKYRVRDQETGEYTWDPATPPAVRASAEDYQANVEAWQNLIAYRPQDFKQLVQAVAREEALGALSEQWGFDPKELPKRLDINGEQAYVSNVLEKYENVLFEKDPRTHQPDFNRLTAIGSQFSQALQEALDIGIPSEAGQYRYAERVLGSAIQAANADTASASARQTTEQKKQAHLQRAAERAASQRTGSVPETLGEQITNPQNPNLPDGESIAKTLLQESGFFSSFAAPQA